MWLLDSPLFLLLIVLNTASSRTAVYNCSSASQPPSVTVGSGSFGLRLQLTVASRLCHIQLIGGGSGYFFVRLNGSLASRYSQLSLSSGYQGSAVASVTVDSQAAYRAFATESSRLYASLSSSSASTEDSMLLTVQLVSQCPSGWAVSSGRCYGATSVSGAAVSFSDAVTACKYVRANLALGFSDVNATLGSAMRLAGWPQDRTVWVGAAVRANGAAYFLNYAMFSHSISASNRQSCAGLSTRDCRCLTYNGEFSIEPCSAQLSYLCSCNIGGDYKFYSLFRRRSHRTNRARVIAAVVLTIAAASAVVSFSAKLREKLLARRSVVAAADVRPVAMVTLNHNAEPPSLSSAATAATTAAATEFEADNYDDQLPSYEEAVTCGTSGVEPD